MTSRGQPQGRRQSCWVRWILTETPESTLSLRPLADAGPRRAPDANGREAGGRARVGGRPKGRGRRPVQARRREPPGRGRGVSPDGQPFSVGLRRAGATAPLAAHCLCVPLTSAPRCHSAPGGAASYRHFSRCRNYKRRCRPPRRGGLSPPAGTASHAARRPPPGLLEPDCELSPLPPPPHPVPPSRAAAKAAPTATQSGRGQAGHGALGAAARLGFCCTAAGAGRPACGSGRQQQWPMVVSELVRGRHLSGAQSQGPALSSSHALGSVRRQAPSSARTSPRDTEGRSGAELLQKIQLCCSGVNGPPRQSTILQMRAHSLLAPPFFHEPQTQAYGGGHTTGFPASGSGRPGVLRTETRRGWDSSAFHALGGHGLQARISSPGCPEHALRAKVDIYFPGSLCFPCPVSTPRAPSTPRTRGFTKVWTTSPFHLASPGEQSHYLVIDLPPLFPGK